MGKLSEFAVIAAIIWVVWAFFATDECDRVNRLAAPVRGAMIVVRAAFKNWADDQTNADLLQRSKDFDQAAQSFLATEFYGNQLNCKPREAHQ